MQNQKTFALKLLDYHGGQNSGLYAVGSCMLSDSDKGRKYSPKNHNGHDKAIKWAISELRNFKKDANFPECVTPKMESDSEILAKQLDKIT